jgi:hypothetical protein
MTALVRDRWADAHQAATAKDLDAEVSAVRRRLWVRRAAGVALGAAALGAACFVLFELLDPDVRLWPYDARWPSPILLWLGVALTAVGVVWSSLGGSGSFIDPADFLTRGDRTWLRTQIAGNRPVAAERRAVAADTARRMVVEGRRLPLYVGFVVVYGNVVVLDATPSSVVLFTAALAWMLWLAVRGAVWAHRARRWLARHS